MCSPDKPDRIWKEMANPYSALGISDSSDSDDELEMEAAAAAAAVDEAEEVWGDAFKAAEAIAAATLGGCVYTQQDVKGLSDADAAAPLSAAFVPCGSTPTSTPPSPSFLIQSGFKPLVYAMALAHGMHADLERAIAAVGDVGYASDALSDDGRALNPLVNTGTVILIDVSTHTTPQIQSTGYTHPGRKRMRGRGCEVWLFCRAHLETPNHTQ